MSDWKLPYEKLVDSLCMPLTGQGLRKKPRFGVNPKADFHVRFGENSAEVCDVSAGGMAIFSEHLVPGGGQCALTINNAMSIQSEVVYCAPMGEWGPSNPPMHKMGLRFLSENDGYRVAMLAADEQ